MKGDASSQTQVVADVEVEVAVAVEVGERGGGRPVAVAAEAGGDSVASSNVPSPRLR